MGTKSWLVMVGVLVAVLGLWSWLAGGALVPPPGSGPIADVRLTAGEPMATAADGAPTAEREVAASAPPTAGNDDAPAIEGVVGAYGGPALSGATVALFAGIPRDGDGALATTETDADGRFRLACPPGHGPWSVRATAVGHLPTVRGATPDGAPLRLWLVPCIEVFGRVLARPGDTPIAGAVVRDGRSTVTCDELGRYRIRAVMAGNAAQLQASADGFVDALHTLRSHDGERAELDFRLSAMAPMTVQVVDRATGAPVAGALVRPSPQGPAFATSDADGRFVIEAGEGQQLTVCVMAPGYCPLSWRWQVEAGPLPWPRLPLVRVANIEGVVTDEQGRGIVASLEVVDDLAGGLAANARWSAEERQASQVPGTLTCEPMPAVVQSDASGRFVVPVRPQARPRHVVASVPACVPAESRSVVLSAPGQTVRVELVLVPGGVVRGNLRRNGKAAQGIVRWRHGPRGAEVRVDATGGYVFVGVPPGSVELTLLEKRTNAPLANATVDVVAGAEVQHDFVWQQAMGTIRGRVTSPSGAPIEGVAVSAHADGSDAQAVTNEAGAYAMEVPDHATYLVAARREGLSKLQEAVAANTTGVDFEFPDMGVLRLRLVEAVSQQPVRVLERQRGVFGVRTAGGQGFRSTDGVVSDTGLVVLRLPVGVVDVSIDLRESGYRPIERQGLVVIAGVRPAEALVELARGAELRLTVRGSAPFSNEVRDGHVFFALEHAQRDAVRGPFASVREGANHIVHDLPMWLADRWLIGQMPDFDGDGRATVPGLAPGTYRLAAFPDDLVFEPSTFAVGANGADVELRWRRR